MCGIVGAVATRDITPVLVEGLRRLEYRGYDSCGVALLADGALTRSRSTARVADLDAQVKKIRPGGLARHLAHALGHARRAGHDQRAPALLARRGRGRPQRHHRELRGDPRGAEARGLRVRHRDRQRGHRAPGPLALQGRPLRRRPRRGGALQGRVRHRGDAQGRAAAAGRRAARVAAGRRARQGRELPRVRRDGARRHDRPDHLPRGRRRRRHRPDARAHRRRHRRGVSQRAVQTVLVGSGAAELGPYRHYMQKEIFEQPRAISDTLETRRRASTRRCSATKRRRLLSGIDSALILACGTSYYAGLTAKYWLESIAGLPTQVEIASEYRYRDSVPNPRSLVVVISQSGETADTLAALKHAQSLGMTTTLGIINVPTSAMARDDEAEVLYARRRRDRRGLDQGVHHAAGRALPAGADGGQAARPPVAPSRSAATCARCATCPRRCRRCWRWSRR